MVAKIGSKAASSSGRPATLVKIWMPPAPSSLTARRASLTEPSTSVIDTAATKVGKAFGMARTQFRHGIVADARQVEADRAHGKVFDRRIRQRDDLAVFAELVHLAEALIEVEQLFDPAQPRRDIPQPWRDAIHLLEELLRDDVTIDVDDRVVGHRAPPCFSSNSGHARVSGHPVNTDTRRGHDRALHVAQRLPDRPPARAMTTEWSSRHSNG